MAKGKGSSEDMAAATTCMQLLLGAGVNVDLVSGPVSAALKGGPHTQGMFCEGPSDRWYALTALHMATVWGNKGAVQALLGQGAKQTPLQKEGVPFYSRQNQDEDQGDQDSDGGEERKSKAKARPEPEPQRLASPFPDGESGLTKKLLGQAVPCRSLWLPVTLAMAALRTLKNDDDDDDDAMDNSEEDGSAGGCAQDREEIAVLLAADIKGKEAEAAPKDYEHYIESLAEFNWDECPTAEKFLNKMLPCALFLTLSLSLSLSRSLALSLALSLSK